MVVVGDWGAGGNGSLMVVEKQRETAEKGEEPGTDQQKRGQNLYGCLIFTGTHFKSVQLPEQIFFLLR